MQATYGGPEIQSLLQKVRIFNKEIGSYQVFAITDDFNYAVKLSNGRILIKVEELQDDEKDALTPERLIVIANRFVTSTMEANLKRNVDEAKQPINPAQKKDALVKKSNTGKTIAIGAIVIIFGFILIKSLSDSSYQDKIMTVEQIELSEPTSFLTADGNYRKNFWGDKFKVNCTITNKATVATYKDAIVMVTYYAKTKTVLTSNEYTIYEVFPPTSTKTVELTIANYKDVESIGWEVISATSYR